MIIISYIFLSVCNLRASIVGFFLHSKTDGKYQKGKYYSIYLHVLHVFHEINQLSWIHSKIITCFCFFYKKGEILLFPHAYKDIVAYKGLHKRKQIICKYGILSEKFRYYWLVRLVSCTDSFSKTFPTWMKMNQYLLMKDDTIWKRQTNCEIGFLLLERISR